MSKRIEWIFCN
uniref:Uncharacterized protein n=1 Tax=Anguilla anguilla TaxID=7936 RepID=A0A0E9XAM7_ANGAN